MKEKLRRLPDSELAVMQALWRADAPLTRPELDAALTHREWTLYGGRPRNFIAALHDADALTPNDIAELEDYLEKAKRGDV